MNTGEKVSELRVRPLIAERSKNPADYNRYKAANHTDTAAKYETEEGQITGDFILGYAEVKKDTRFRSVDSVSELKSNVEDIAKDITWKTEMIQRMKVEDRIYREYNMKGSVESIEAVVNSISKTIGDSDEKVAEEKVKETAEEIFKDSNVIE